MLKLQSAWRRHFGSVLTVIWELLRDGWQFMYVIARPRTAVAAEVLFLRKQLAYYQDHNIRPGRLTDAARLSLVLWSRLFDWKEALAIVTVRLWSAGIARVSSCIGVGNRGVAGHSCRREFAI